MPNDVIGVSMLKPTSKQNPQFHYIPMNDPHYDYRRDSRLELLDSAKLGLTHSPADPTLIPFDYYKFVDATSAKITLLTSDRYDRSRINRTQLGDSLNFLHTPRDWRNFETTCYIFVEDVTDPNAMLTLKGRTGKQFGAGNCEGFAYHTDIRISDCATRFNKSQFYGFTINGNWNTNTDAKIIKGQLSNKWTGIKFICYNQDPILNRFPILETWVDWSAINDWKKYDSLMDAPGVSPLGGSAGGNCGGSAAQPGVWGGPCIHIEFNKINSLRFKNISCREIDPLGVFSGEGSAAGGGVPLSPDIILPPLPPKPTIDQFKVKMFYSSKSNGEFWFMPNDVNADQRIGGELPKISFSGQNSDGSWKVKNQPKVRYGILTTAGFDETKMANLTPSAMVTAGFMQNIKDWRNVEMTAYFRVNTYSTASSLPANIRFVLRGGLSNSAATPLVGGKAPSCEATQYHFEVFLTGKTQFQKMLQYPSAITGTNTSKTNGFTFTKGKWIGIKAVLYNVASTAVLTLYLDEYTTDISKPSNNWKQSITYTDAAAGWNAGVGAACGGTNTDVILWGGPVATFSCDNITDFDIANCSIREIDTTLDPPTEQPFLGDTGALGDFSGWLPLASDWGLR
jgi:hypothetical protein